MKIRRLLLIFIFFILMMTFGCSLSGEVKYRVKFFVDGKVISSESYNKGDTIVIPDDPESENGFFVGWDINNDCVADEITICNNNMNIRAIFGETEKFTVIFKNGDLELSKKSYAKGEMPTLPTEPVKEGFVFVGWDMNGDDEVDTVASVSENVTYVALFRDDNRTYTVEFYVGSERISRADYHLNDSITKPSTNPTKTKTQEYSYEFLGWDVNNDGVVETFPYSVKGNHRFVAVFKETLNKYTYKLYDGLTKLKEETVDYGTNINYDGALYKKLLGRYYYLIGWDKNGDNKADDDIITSDVTFQAVYADTQIVVMHYESEEHVLYVPKGDTFDLYEPTLPSSRKCVWYLDSSFETPYNHKAMIEGNLELYGRSELSYVIDTSVLEGSLKSQVSSEEELISLFNYLVFNRVYSHKVKLNYEYANDEFATLLCDNCSIDSSYQLSTSFSPLNKELTLTIQYKNVNNDNTKSLYTQHSISYYTQHDSLNLKTNEAPRNDGFKLFIDDVSNTFEVSTSEQLYYVLEHGYRPIIKEENTELKNLYNKMRKVLQDINNDEMTDYEKVLAIYEWLVMNVTYDRVALQLSSDPNVSNFHSFYLEGVFDDNLAVCDGISKALVCLCNMEGIPAIRVTGTGRQNHAWNKVCINNSWYVVDATSGGSIINDTFEVLTHRFFMITDENFSAIYQEDGKYYPDFMANGVYDYYDNNYYEYDGHTYKLRCESKSDLVRVLKWFKDCEGEDLTVDVELDFSYADFSSLMSSAMSEARYTTSINYSLDGKILLLIK